MYIKDTHTLYYIPTQINSITTFAYVNTYIKTIHAYAHTYNTYSHTFIMHTQ